MSTFRTSGDEPSIVVRTAEELKARQTERMKRLDRLKAAVKEYADDEKQRIDTEVSVLGAIRESRRSGAGASGDASTAVTKVAAANLSWFLRGA